MHLIIKITSNALVTLVAAKDNYFHEPFKTIKTVRISTGKFIRQRVPDCRAGTVERPSAVRAESTARHSETVPSQPRKGDEHPTTALVISSSSSSLLSPLFLSVMWRQFEQQKEQCTIITFAIN